MLHAVLMVVHFFAAAAIVGLVLIQKGKGADAGAGFGAGASGTVFGARGAGTALSRATAILAGVFMITSLSLTYLSSHTKAVPTSILERAPVNAPAPAGTPAPVSAPAAGSPPAPGAPAPAGRTDAGTTK